MRGLFFAFLTGGLLLGPVAQGQEDRPDPRALIQKAIDTHRETLQGKRLAQYERYQTKDEEIVLHGETFRQPERVFKDVAKFAVDGKRAVFTTVYNGTKGWHKVDDGDDSSVKEFEDEDYQHEREQEHLHRVGMMVDLVKDRSFVLKHLGDEKFAGQDVVGVLVTAKGHRDTRIYFDKSTNLMAGMRYRKADRKSGKDVDTEVVFSDYRRLGPSARDSDALKRVGVTDAGGALGFLRKQILSKAEEDGIKELIAKLGDPAFKVRKEAMDQLHKEGARALSYLREAAKNPTTEIARRAQNCLTTLQGEGADQLAAAAVRLVGYSPPADAVAVLLDYLPQAQDSAVAAEVKAVLVHLAEDKGKPHPLLLEALSSKEVWQKETAAAVLGRDGGAYLKKPGRPIYMTDSKYPARVAHHEDGKLVSETRILEVRYFNRFEDAMFQEPK